MAALLSCILAMSLCSCATIPIVLLLRLLLKKAPKWINVLLWGIVALSMLVILIVALNSNHQDNDNGNPSDEEFTVETPDEDPGNIPQPPGGKDPIPPGDDNNSQEITAAQSADDTNALEEILNCITCIREWIENLFTDLSVAVVSNAAVMIIWCIGAASMLSYTAVSYWRLRRKIATAVRLIDNIYQSENVSFPFVLGIFKPRIYLPFKIRLQDLEHVVAHERAHIRRRDHWWKPLGFLMLTIQWFNPLMWVAYILLCRDIELACDEKVIRELGNEQRANYTQSLVTCSVKRYMVTACPLAFGAVGVKDRVRAVMNYRKPTLWIKLTAAVICVAVSLSAVPFSVLIAQAASSKLVEYPVPGGSLLFDCTTATIVGYMGNPDEFEMPAKINGVDVKFVAYGNTTLPISSDIVYYPVSGGGLLFDPATGTIIGYMGNPDEFEMPAKINGVDVKFVAYGNTTLPISSDIVYYPVSGGGLLFDLATGTIVGYMGTPDEFIFPTEIEGTPVVAIADGITTPHIPSGTIYYPILGGSLLFDPGTQTIIGYMGSPTSIKVPSKINGLPVVAIGSGAFRYCSSLSSIVIPEGVETIGVFAFAHCPNLSRIDLPDSLRTIGSLAFRLCESLRSIDLPEGLDSIGNEAFAYCSNLTSITIPASVKSLGSGAFFMCHNLKEICVKESNPYYSSDENGILFNKDRTVLHVYPAGLRGRYTIPSGVTKIGPYAFSGSSLSHITIPDTVTVIDIAAFNHCSNLTHITIPLSVVAIDSSAFSKCTSLTSIAIPISVISLGNSVFSGCSNLTSIHFGGSQEQWVQLTKGSYTYNNATMHYNAI